MYRWSISIRPPARKNRIAVIEAMDHYYRTSNANIHRGVHTLAEEATALYESARERIAAFIGGEAARKR